MGVVYYVRYLPPPTDRPWKFVASPTRKHAKGAFFLSATKDCPRCYHPMTPSAVKDVLTCENEACSFDREVTGLEIYTRRTPAHRGWRLFARDNKEQHG